MLSCGVKTGFLRDWRITGYSLSLALSGTTSSLSQDKSSSLGLYCVNKINMKKLYQLSLFKSKTTKSLFILYCCNYYPDTGKAAVNYKHHASRQLWHLDRHPTGSARRCLSQRNLPSLYEFIVNPYEFKHMLYREGESVVLMY